MLKTQQKKKDWNWNWEVWAICSKFSACPYMRSDWRFGEVLWNSNFRLLAWHRRKARLWSLRHLLCTGFRSNDGTSKAIYQTVWIAMCENTSFLSMFLESKSECHWLLCPEHVYYLDFGLLSVHNSAALARAPLLLHRCCNSPQAENLKNSVVWCGWVLISSKFKQSWPPSGWFSCEEVL